MTADPNDMELCSQLFAFIGNSMLTPMNQTSQIGLDPIFWASLSDLGDTDVRESLCRCQTFAASMAEAQDAEFDPVTRVSVEFTSLFVGPPRPAAAPWETAYREGGSTVGFGQATFEMRRLLQEAGLKVDGGRQYEDHMGVELLVHRSDEEKLALLRAHVARIPTQRVVSYCISCDQGLSMGGADSASLLNLLFDRSA